MTGLSPRQRDVLRYVETYRRQHGYAPSVRALCELLGVESTNTVAGHLAALYSKGYLSRTSRVARSYRATPSGLRELGVSP